VCMYIYMARVGVYGTRCARKLGTRKLYSYKKKKISAKLRHYLDEFRRRVGIVFLFSPTVAFHSDELASREKRFWC